MSASGRVVIAVVNVASGRETKRRATCTPRIGTTDAMVPHIAHFRRCRTRGCLLERNRHKRTVAPSETPATKWIVKAWLRTGIAFVDAIKFLSVDAMASGMNSSPSEKAKLVAIRRAAGT